MPINTSVAVPRRRGEEAAWQSRIVTDSTSDLPADVIEQLGITVVAQNVHFGTETFKDNVTITPDTFFSMLASSKELPKTSQASPGEFKEVYDRARRGSRRHRVHPRCGETQRHLQLRSPSGGN